jgi:uncharacterized protein
MRIWLDTSLHAYRKSDECNDCSPPSIMSTRITWPLSDGDIAVVKGLILEHATPLYVQQCGEERWLVCNPTGLGHIAVFDAEAILLFSLFETPITIAQIAHMMGDWPREKIEKIVTLFYRLDFLRDITHPFPANEREAPQILTAWLHVTNECNLRCHYCYLDKTKEDMTSDAGHKAIDAIFRSALRHRFREIRVKYAGGEASLHMMSVIAFHDYAVQCAQKHGITLEGTILSNGVALSQRSIDHLKARHISVTISLDGLGNYHDSQRPFISGKGSSQYVLRTIDRLLANGITPSITITISRRNLDGLTDLVDYVLDRDLPFSLNYYRENECSATIADLCFADEQIITAMRSVYALIEEKLPSRSLLGCLLDKANITAPHNHTCGVGQNYLVIDQFGGVAKCQMEIKRTITTINTDDPLQMIREDHRGVRGLAVEEKKGCRTCEWRYWCTGGCPVVTYRSTGRYDVKSPNCNIYKTLFPEVLRLEALRLLNYEKPISLYNE